VGRFDSDETEGILDLSPGADELDETLDPPDPAEAEAKRVGRVHDGAGGAGFQRDQAAEERDRAAEKRDRAAEFSESLSVVGNLKATLIRSALARQDAASDRQRASQDRAAGAREREDAFLDALTGVYRRGAGFAELEREIQRAKRTQRPLALAFVDVDGLKAINDLGGHAAGDRMLVDVAETVRRHLRSYDLIIRYGGDEFLCAIPGLDTSEATERFRLVNRALADASEPGSVTVGVAELRREDSLEDLVARADASLYRERQLQRSSPADSP
jgi:diguanylate cyclase (GGDEF)-like protein